MAKKLLEIVSLKSIEKPFGLSFRFRWRDNLHHCGLVYFRLISAGLAIDDSTSFR